MNQIDTITEYIGLKFRSFGGGQATEGNPIAAALKDKPFQFAAGVDVKEVVMTVLEIAAAPKLYEACKAEEKARSYVGASNIQRQLYNKAADLRKAALATAEEKQ